VEEQDQNRRLVLRVRIPRWQDRPAVEDYQDLLAMRIQELVNQEPKEYTRELVQDLYPPGGPAGRGGSKGCGAVV
jgi:hypothetical protein